MYRYQWLGMAYEISIWLLPVLISRSPFIRRLSDLSPPGMNLLLAALAALAVANLLGLSGSFH